MSDFVVDINVGSSGNSSSGSGQSAFYNGPTSPTFFTVVGDFASFVADSDDDEDADPDVLPITAKVTFTPMLSSGDMILATHTDPRPTAYVPTAITGIIDTDGQLKLNSTPFGDYSFTPIRLLANTALLELSSPLDYEVSFSDVVINGQPSSINSFTFEAPNSDVELNLVTIYRQPGQNASGIVKIAPTGVRYENDAMVFTYGGVDIPDPLPLSTIKGDKGDKGDAATVTVGTVSTGNAGSSVSVVNSGSSGAAVLDFTIPRGDTGAAATVAVGTVTTGSPGSSAAVTNSGSSGAAVLNFTIPRGDPGATNTAPDTHAATSKATPVDNDELPLVDSAASWGLKKLSWANLKAAVKSYYDSVTATLTNKDLTSATNTFPSTLVTTTGTQTLTGKTLTAPKISAILEPTNGRKVMEFGGDAAAVNNFYVFAGGSPQLLASGADANINVDLVPKGTGQVRANYVPVVTTTGTQSLSNKTLSSPTINTPTIAGNITQSSTSTASFTIDSTATDQRSEISLNQGGENKLYFQYRHTSNSTYPNSVRIQTNSTTNADIMIGTNAYTDIFIAGGQNSLTRGHIGIGKLSPACALDVTGEIRSSVAGSTSTSVVTVGGAQSLSNKTLASPTISGSFFDSNGNRLIQSAPVAAAVNYFQIANAAARGSPSITAAGTDENVAVNIFSKGSTTAAAINLRSPGNGIALSAVPVASGVNYVQATNAVTGSPAQITAAGSDTNIDLSLAGKGTGAVTANGHPVVTRRASVPATATSTGTVGQIAYDSNYVYICTATDTWKRAALSTW